jgi:hypothetical protein
MARNDVATVSIILAVALWAIPALAGESVLVRRPPDLSGLWTNSSLTELERPQDFKSLVPTDADARAFEQAHRGKPPILGPLNNAVGGPETDWWERDVGLARIRGQIRTSWIVSPADGQLPFTPAAKAANRALRDRRRVDFDGPESRDLEERCASVSAAGPPLDNGGLNDNFQLVQTRDHLAIYAEWMHVVRIVRLQPTGRVPRLEHPPASVRFPMGDSIGWWEGGALVIETTNFQPADVAAPNGDANADMRIVERLTRTSPTELLYAFSVTNPARYSQTWDAEMLLSATKGPIYEYACHEGNYSLTGILAGARHEEAVTKAAERRAP